jgi:hypothetical protein
MINIMAIVAIISINVIGLNSPIKRQSGPQTRHKHPFSIKKKSILQKDMG